MGKEEEGGGGGERERRLQRKKQTNKISWHRTITSRTDQHLAFRTSRPLALSLPIFSLFALPPRGA